MGVQVLNCFAIGCSLPAAKPISRNCGRTSIPTSDTSLRRDYAAVRAGVELPWSTGLVEGAMNRLKMVKRTMFGRASFALLQRRVLLAS